MINENNNNIKIALIGTGIMGAPMAQNIAKSGFSVTVWNRSTAKAEAIKSSNIAVADSPKSALKDSDGVVIMLNDGPSVDLMLLGGDGLISCMKKGAFLLIMSSIPVETAKKQAEAAQACGIRYIDAPVSGGEKGAIEGNLAIMAGGSSADFNAAMPLLKSMGRPTHVGPVGCGQLAKLANQIIVANTIAAVAEALILVESGGADSAAVRSALLGGFADSTILKQHGQRMIDRQFKPGGPAKYQLRDIKTAQDSAQQFGVTLPVTNLVSELFEDFVNNQGGADMDHSGLFDYLANVINR